MLHIYDTLKQQKTQFIPLEKGKVRLYVCGMTVYDYCHIGHARVLVAFDMITRYLRSLGYDVAYVRNITDIDDKIIQRAKDNNEPVSALTQRFIDAMHEDAKALGVLAPTKEPRATDWVEKMVEMISLLIEKNYAYVADNGDVNYRVEAFKAYGKLSHQCIADLKAGARIAIDNSKASPLDFVLWKKAKADEPSWPSPWGQGRPGWHIECSTMSNAELGEQLDIHGGGFDLQFPHHENEIAQSEALTEKPFVQTWMHVGFVQVNQEKMSKSLGNFFTIRDVLAQYAPEVVRYFLLSSHYRSQLNYSDQALDNAKAALTRLYLALRDVAPVVEPPVDTDYHKQFAAKMDDDFNTPEALAVLFELARDINQAKVQQASSKAAQLAGVLKQLAGVLGLLVQSPADFLQTTDSGLSHEAIHQQVDLRNKARDNRDWQAADDIRQALLKKGIVLEDTDKGTVWRFQ